MYLKRDDLVMVISGKERGRTGKVIRVLHEDEKVLVQGINLVHKHIRRSQKNPQGGRIKKEAPLPASKVMLVDPKTNKPTRIGYRFEEGRKVRYSKKSGDPI